MINLPTEVLDYINEFIFKPKTKEELQKAVNLWCTNKDDALDRYGHISNWDTSLINDMSRLFQYSNFNENINDWDVSNVTNMEYMFYYCKNFNQPLNNWDVSNVTTMCCMFQCCINFNQPLNDCF